MLEKVFALIQLQNTEALFFELLQKQFPKGGFEYNFVERAYRDTMDAFNGIKRDGGTPYFGHPESVALIVFEHLRIRDHNVIAAALMHDNVEDLSGWTFERIARDYSQSTAELVWWVTKPPISEYRNSKIERDNAYHRRLRSAPRYAAIIKLADRLHNVMTLWETNLEKRKRKIQETWDFYVPLAEDQIILIHELEKAIFQAGG